MENLKILHGDEFINRWKIKEFVDSSSKRVEYIRDILPNDFYDISIFNDEPIYIIVNPSNDVIKELTKNYKKIPREKYVIILFVGQSPDNRLSFFKENKKNIDFSSFIEYTDNESCIEFMHLCFSGIDKKACLKLRNRTQPLIEKNNTLVLNTMVIANELEKLSLYKDKINEDDIDIYLVKDAKYQIWIVLDCLVRQNISRYLKEISQVVKTTDDAFKFCGLIMSECKLILMIKEAIKNLNTTNEFSIASYINNLKINESYDLDVETTHASKINAHPFRVKNIINKLNEIDDDHILKCIKNTLKASKELRGGSLPSDLIMFSIIF
jgi:DNA polymerase III delta subunit